MTTLTADAAGRDAAPPCESTSPEDRHGAWPRDAASRCAERGVLSAIERARRPHALVGRGVHVALLVFLLVVGLGPLLWLAKASVSSTQDTLRHPMAPVPERRRPREPLDGVDRRPDRPLLLEHRQGGASARGSCSSSSPSPAATCSAILKPWYARFVTALVVATLFIPPVVLLVPLFLTVLDLPIVGMSLLNNYWAVWLPAGASAFNVLLVKRFFENLPAS